MCSERLICVPLCRGAEALGKGEMTSEWGLSWYSYGFLASQYINLSFKIDCGILRVITCQVNLFRETGEV